MKQFETLSRNVAMMVILSLFPGIAGAGQPGASTADQGLNDPVVNNAVLGMLSVAQQNKYWATQWTVLAALRKNSSQAQKILKTIHKINQIQNTDVSRRIELIKNIDNAAISADGNLNRYLAALKGIEDTVLAEAPSDQHS